MKNLPMPEGGSLRTQRESCAGGPELEDVGGQSDHE